MKHAVKNQYQAFYQHRRRARLKKIKFQFTYDEWMLWWFDQLGPEWPKLRGRGKGKYCMARKNDTGPYHINNVDCILFEQNSKDAWKHGIHFDKFIYGHKLSIDDANEIKATKGKQKDIARKFGVTSSMISHIKRGVHWKT